MDRNAKITAARITEMPKSMFDPMPKVMVKLNDSDTEHKLFEYYPDELSFTAEEFIGKTVDQALQMRHNRDVAYLRS